MRIWLDDERDPTEQFIQDNYGATSDLIWIKSPHECTELIRSGKVRFIDFDNDLGYWWPEPSSGYEVAKIVEQLAFEGKIPKIEWDVHTENSAARVKIVMAMSNADKFWEQNKC